MVYGVCYIHGVWCVLHHMVNGVCTWIVVHLVCVTPCLGLTVLRFGVHCGCMGVLSVHIYV